MCSSQLWNEELFSTYSRVEYLQKLFEILHGRFVSSPPFFKSVQSFIYTTMISHILCYNPVLLYLRLDYYYIYVFFFYANEFPYRRPNFIIKYKLKHSNMSKGLLTFFLSCLFVCVCVCVCVWVCMCVCVCVIRELLISEEKNPDFSLAVILILMFTGHFERVVWACLWIASVSPKMYSFPQIF